MTENNTTTKSTKRIDFERLRTTQAQLAIDVPSIEPPHLKDIYFSKFLSCSHFHWSVYGDTCSTNERIALTTALKEAYEEGYHFAKGEATENGTDISCFIEDIKNRLVDIRTKKVSDANAALTTVFDNMIDHLRRIIMTAVGVVPFRGAKAEAFIPTNWGQLELTLSHFFVAWLTGSDNKALADAFDQDFCERLWNADDSYPDEEYS